MLTIVFYILAAITLSAGVFTIASRNPIHSAVAMIVCFFSLAGHFLLLDAQFLAIVQIIVYAGAIMIMLLFALMLMNLSEVHEEKKKIATRIAAVSSAGLMALVVLAAIVKADPIVKTYQVAGADYQSVAVVGQVLFDEYLVPFEFAAILLITAMLGAVLISKREKNA